MIRNLVVSGCSFTKTTYENEWALALVKEFDPEVHVNLAESGAGNHYIADSLQHYLTNSKLNPRETLVLVMWSGPSRIDLTVADEYYNMLQTPYKTSVLGKNYVFSGGELGNWQSDTMLRPVFENLYKTKNFNTLAQDTITNIIQTRDFLKHKGYSFWFMSYVNYWQLTPEYVSDMDLSIGYYAPELASVSDDGNWVWINDNKDCFYEYAKTRQLISSDGFHPDEQAHQEFARQFLVPKIKGYFK